MKAYELNGQFLVADIGYLVTGPEGGKIEEVEFQDVTLEYDQDKGVLKGGAWETRVIQDTGEDYFLRAMFAKAPGIPIHSEEISAVMFGLPLDDEEIIPKEKIESLRRNIKDAKRRLNEKIREVFFIEDYFMAKNNHYYRKG